MKKRSWSFNCFMAFALCLSAIFVTIPCLSDAVAQEKGLTDGKDVYEMHCIGCHGAKGDGNGEVAADFVVKPRNFTTGMFKFTTTSRNSLPTDEDLRNILTYGLPTSAMPNFKLMHATDMDAVIGYIKTFSDRWTKERSEKKYPDVTAPAYVGNPDSIAKGEKLFTKNCIMCHGAKQDIPDVTFSLKWSDKETCADKVRPAVFSHGSIKRGGKVEDIYMSITAGVGNTPMLSFADILSNDERWHLTSYILEEMGKVRR